MTDGDGDKDYAYENDYSEDDPSLVPSLQKFEREFGPESVPAMRGLAQHLLSEGQRTLEKTERLLAEAQEATLSPFAKDAKSMNDANDPLDEALEEFGELYGQEGRDSLRKIASLIIKKRDAPPAPEPPSKTLSDRRRESESPLRLMNMIVGERPVDAKGDQARRDDYDRRVFDALASGDRKAAARLAGVSLRELNKTESGSLPGGGPGG